MSQSLQAVQGKTFTERLLDEWFKSIHSRRTSLLVNRHFMIGETTGPFPLLVALQAFGLLKNNCGDLMLRCGRILNMTDDILGGR